MRRSDIDTNTTISYVVPFLAEMQANIEEKIDKILFSLTSEMIRYKDTEKEEKNSLFMDGRY